MGNSNQFRNGSKIGEEDNNYYPNLGQLYINIHDAFQQMMEACGLKHNMKSDGMTDIEVSTLMWFHICQLARMDEKHLSVIMTSPNPATWLPEYLTDLAQNDMWGIRGYLGNRKTVVPEIHAEPSNPASEEEQDEFMKLLHE